jgi:hypothetical protein
MVKTKIGASRVLLRLGSVAASAALLILAAGSASARVRLVGQHLSVEDVAGNDPDDHRTGHCLGTTDGQTLILGYVSPGDGIRHTILGRCLDDGTVVVLDDYIPTCGTELQCSKASRSNINN